MKTWARSAGRSAPRICPTSMPSSPATARLPCRRAGWRIKPDKPGSQRAIAIERRIRMPVQRFAPMTKDFATFDCDAHVPEPPLIWERAHEFLTRDELDALKRTIWWDPDGRLLIVNGRAGIGLGSPRKGGIPGTMPGINNSGPGVKHGIQRPLNVRNLHPNTALAKEQDAYLHHPRSHD